MRLESGRVTVATLDRLTLALTVAESEGPSASIVLDLIESNELAMALVHLHLADIKAPVGASVDHVAILCARGARISMTRREGLGRLEVRDGSGSAGAPFGRSQELRLAQNLSRCAMRLADPRSSRRKGKS